MAAGLDGALGISDVYNDILAATQSLRKEEAETLAPEFALSAEMLRWAKSQGQRRVLAGHRYMSVTGLSNVIHVFNDVEKGKLRNIEYLECDACWGGCGGGNLTVDNIYVTLSKINRLLSEMPNKVPRLTEEVERRYPNEDFSIRGRIRPRIADNSVSDLKERVKKIKLEESVISKLPGLNCGLCGAPSCKTFAKDVAAGSARLKECVFFSADRLQQLRGIYLRDEKRSPEGESSGD